MYNLERIAFSYLNDSERGVYKDIENTISASRECLTTTMDSEHFLEVLESFVADNPQYVNWNRFSIETRRSFKSESIYFKYTAGGSRGHKMTSDVLGVAKDIAMRACGDSPYERLLSAYGELQEAITYGKDARNPGNEHDAFGALINHRAVCDGISDALSLVAQMIGIPCRRVSGRLDKENNQEPHAWNIVKLGRDYCHLDLTLEIANRQTAAERYYNYFCVSDTEISANHVWDMNGLPICDSQQWSFFHTRGLEVRSHDDFEHIVRNGIQKNAKVFDFKLMHNFCLRQESLNGVTELFTECYEKYRRSNTGNTIGGIWSDDMRCAKIIIMD